MFLIWYDNDRKRKLAEKVAQAAERYTERFGTSPQVVLLNPAQAGEMAEVAGLPVRATPLVAPHSLYIGADDADDAPAPSVAA